MSPPGRCLGRMWLLMVAAEISACSVLPAPTAHDIYRLPPPSVTVLRGAPCDISLRIALPSVSELLSSSRIVVVPEGNRLSAYREARWSSSMPVLWRERLLDAFHDNGRIARLSHAAEGLQADVELGGTLRAFQAEYRGALPEVVIQFDAHLVDTRTRRIIASRRFAATDEVDGTQLPAVVDAFGRASDAIAGELIDWALPQLGQCP